MTLAFSLILGGAWRWADGRGLPHDMTWLRTVICAVIAFLILVWHMNAMPAVVFSAVFAGTWTPRQKEREDLQEMLFRWSLLGGLGGWLAFLTGLWLPGAVLTFAGPIVGVLAWVGTQDGFWKWLPKWWPVKWLDPSAVTDILAGAIAFGALGLA